MLTALRNRVGDVALLITIALVSRRGFLNYGLTTFSLNREISLGLGLVLLARITKSAQIPFSAWLPAAIAAPTPVSALVHSSTLVTAGVYLLLRFNYVWLERGWSNILLGLGLLTMLLAGTGAVLELDIKKIIALSTLSQLGVIFFRLGLGLPIVAFFHLIAHAYFKAILFIAAGALIHGVKDYQNIRKIGGSRVIFPVARAIVLVGRLSLCGVPFMAGFYSKDLILELFIIGGFQGSLGVGLTLATGATVIYSVRLGCALFGSSTGRESFSCEGDSDFTIRAGMRILLIPSAIGGWALIGLASFDPLIFFSGVEKTFVLVLVIVSGAAWFALSPQLGRNIHLSRFIHQMWFFPHLFRPSVSLKGSQVRGLGPIRDSGFSLILWSWVKTLKEGAIYFFRVIRVRLLRRLILGLGVILLL